jgi:mono/diheme cytochrome c family protein
VIAGNYFPPTAARPKLFRVRLLAAFAFASALSAQQTIPLHEARKAQALLRTQLPCLGCHELDGDGGHSAPSLSTVGARRSAAYIKAIVEDPQRVLPGTAMPKTLMPSPVRDLLIRFLSAGAVATEEMPRVSMQPKLISAPPPNGAALYAKWCASCHGATGDGDGPDAKYQPVPPAKHRDARAMQQRPDDSLFDVIAVGGAPWGRSARMPAFGATLSPAEIRALVAQIRTLCKCEGPRWSRAGARQ